MIKTFFYLACLFLLVGCSDVKDSLGISASKSDDYAVVEQSPLTMPNDLALPNPYEKTQQQTLEDKALSILTNNKKG